MADRPIDDQILKFLSNHAQQSYRPKEVARKLGITDQDEYRRTRSALSRLVESGQVATDKNGRIMHKGRKPAGKERTSGGKEQKSGGRGQTPGGKGRTQLGRLSMNPRGFGFVTVEGLTDDLFVAASNTGTALDGDLVRIEVSARSRQGGSRSRREAEVVEVVERHRQQAVGTYRTRGRLGYVVPDDQRLTHDIYVEDAAGASNGDKVVVTIDRFEHKRGAPEGRIIEIVGPESDPVVRVSSLALSLGVRLKYPEPAEAEAEKNAARGRPISASAIANRTDLRDRLTVTIDPDDANDFDDAIHIEELADGNVRVGVHVADVSHYVDPESELDREAYFRGTSAYLVDRVVPMLPEVLSAEVCSLRPDEDKLALSCIADLTRKGDVVSVDVLETIIRSDYRLTYGEAQLILDGREHKSGAMVRSAAALARTLRERRTAGGSIEFDLPEVKVVLDEDGTPLDIRPRERLETHRLIEELMLLANRSVARWMKDRPFVFRVHAPPDVDKLAQVARYVSMFGFELSLSDGFARPQQINTLLEAIRDTPQQPVIQSALLRAMSKAVYSHENIGHYGLAVEDYTHFTSPIRRYPDLIVHRLVKARLREARGGGKRSTANAAGAGRLLPSAPASLSEASRHCSERERIAVDAERASVKLKQVEYASDHVGDSFAGVITGVSAFGVFVQLSDLLVEGMVHVRDIDDDFYEYDEATWSLVGTRRGRVFQVGKLATVVIVRADTESREIDLYFADETGAAQPT